MRNIIYLLLVIGCAHPTPSPVARSPVAASPVAASPAPAVERFDEKVRQDFFDGMRGDAAALDRAMALCEAELAKDPRHAEAMVWHGAGLTARSVARFRAGDQAGGIDLYTRGLAEMDLAVALAPDKVGVRIPRGAVLLSMAPHVPEPQRAKLLHDGVADYEATLALQDRYFANLTLHSREQLLYGLTDGYASLGDQVKARAFYERMIRDAAGSDLLARAKTRAEGGGVTGPTPCEQCHPR